MLKASHVTVDLPLAELFTLTEMFKWSASGLIIRLQSKPAGALITITISNYNHTLLSSTFPTLISLFLLPPEKIRPWTRESTKLYYTSDDL